MQIRDRLVAIVLAAGLLLGMVGWQAVNPWLGLAIAVIAVVSACAIYRIDPTHGAEDDDDPERITAPDRSVSTRRRAAGRP